MPNGGKNRRRNQQIVDTAAAEKRSKSHSKRKHGRPSGGSHRKGNSPALDVGATALGHRLGWDSESGFYIRKANAFIADAQRKREFDERGVISPEQSSYGKDTAKAWGGQYNGEFGDFNPRKDAVVPFDEVIGLVTASNTYAVTSYDVNPGVASTFPQLSVDAAQYERYMFANLEFYVTPLVTVASANASGKVVMSLDLEGVEEADPTSATQQQNNTIHADGMPWEAFGFQVAGVVRHRESWFVRRGVGFPAGGDPRAYDVGRLYVGTYANTGTGPAISELRVRGVCFFYDKLTDPPGIPRCVTLSEFGSSSPTTLTGSFSAVANLVAGSFAPTAGWDVGNNAGWTVSGGALLIAPRAATYKVVVHVDVNSTTNFSALQYRLMVAGVAGRTGRLNFASGSLTDWEFTETYFINCLELSTVTFEMLATGSGTITASANLHLLTC